MKGIGEPAPIYPDLIPLWEAFKDLNCSRQGEMGPVGLTWLDVSRYCEDHGLRGPTRLRWIRILRAMDREWMKAQLVPSSGKEG